MPSRNDVTGQTQLLPPNSYTIEQTYLRIYELQKAEELENNRANKKFTKEKFLSRKWDTRVNSWILYVVVACIAIAAIVNLSLGSQPALWYGILGTAIGILVPRPKIKSKSADQSAQTENQAVNSEVIVSELKDMVDRAKRTEREQLYGHIQTPDDLPLNEATIEQRQITSSKRFNTHPVAYFNNNKQQQQQQQLLQAQVAETNM